ncbi:PREDICTED: uncharacterized protein LOC101290870 [Fragaria vesca subsp. vesca]
MSNIQTDSSSTRNLDTPGTDSEMIRWSPPPFDRVKINFDGSVWRNSAARGFVIRTPNGNPLVAASSNFGITTISVAEALSLRNSLICAKERGLSRVEVEGDSKLVIDAVNGIAASPWRILKLVQEIRSNAVANVGHKVGDVRFWEECVPPEASLALSFDYVNRGYPFIRAFDDSSTSATVSAKIDAAENAKATTDKDYPGGEFQFREASAWRSFVVKLRMLFACPWERVKKGSVLTMTLRGQITDQVLTKLF